MLKTSWKRAWLTGGFALLLLSGSAVSAAGRPSEPTLLQPLWSPFSLQSDYLTKWNTEVSPYKTLSLYKPMMANQLASALSPASVDLTSPLMAAIETLAFTTKAAKPETDTQQQQAQPMNAYLMKAPAPEAKASKAEAAPVEATNKIVTVTGATITPKQTLAAVASAYSGSAEENGGYAGKDYFGNKLQVGTIAVDPKVIPLGSTVYVTGYSYDGLPAGGMMAKAADIGGAIKGNRIDLYVPGSSKQADKFGYQNVTVYVVD